MHKRNIYVFTAFVNVFTCWCVMSANLFTIFIKNVQELLHSKKINQTELASKLGVSRQTVSQFTSGEHEPRISKMADIAKALGVPPFYLLMSAQERAQWDEIGKPKQSDLSAIERRLAALEAAAKPSETSESTDNQNEDSLIEGERVLQELEHASNDRPLKKHERKRGNG